MSKTGVLFEIEGAGSFWGVGALGEVGVGLEGLATVSESDNVTLVFTDLVFSFGLNFLVFGFWWACHVRACLFGARTVFGNPKRRSLGRNSYGDSGSLVGGNKSHGSCSSLIDLHSLSLCAVCDHSYPSFTIASSVVNHPTCHYFLILVFSVKAVHSCTLLQFCICLSEAFRSQKIVAFMILLRVMDFI